jgi:hypothetical protein
MKSKEGVGEIKEEVSKEEWRRKRSRRDKFNNGRSPKKKHTKKLNLTNQHPTKTTNFTITNQQQHKIL